MDIKSDRLESLRRWAVRTDVIKSKRCIHDGHKKSWGKNECLASPSKGGTNRPKLRMTDWMKVGKPFLRSSPISLWSKKIQNTKITKLKFMGRRGGDKASVPPLVILPRTADSRVGAPGSSCFHRRSTTRDIYEQGTRPRDREEPKTAQYRHQKLFV